MQNSYREGEAHKVATSVLVLQCVASPAFLSGPVLLYLINMLQFIQI